jgi:hypothetical protein
MDILLKYFPGLNQTQLQHFEKLQNLYATWNAQINVISRKDIESLYERHVLHSLAIAKFIQFKPNTKILDIGTGGGFPGIPLSIFFPEIEVTMIDSIAKKIKVGIDFAGYDPKLSLMNKTSVELTEGPVDQIDLDAEKKAVNEKKEKKIHLESYIHDDKRKKHDAEQSSKDPALRVPWESPEPDFSSITVRDR